MKKIMIIIVLVISSCSFYGVVNDEGEKVTDIQEIMKMENITQNELVAKEVVVQEKIVAETKQEEQPKTEETRNTAIKSTSKNKTKKELQTTAKNTENKKTNTSPKTNTVKSSQTTTPKDNTPKQEIPKKENSNNINSSNVPKCTDTKHGVGAGNTNKWFATKEKAIALYNTEIKKWGDEWTSDKIDDETYYKNCPDGYEIWSCPFCKKWTINFYY